jgi:hypothetical protein
MKRLARDVKVFILLKESIQSMNCTIQYLNHSFEETPEGQFIQTILAGAAQLERQQNTRQVVQKMKARLEDGYWVFADGSYQKGDWVLHGSRYPLDRFGLTMENHMLPPIDENLLPLFPQNSHWQNVVNAMFQVSSLATRDEENEYKEKGLL